MTRLEELDILIEAQNKATEAAWAPFKALIDSINTEFNAKVDSALQVIDPTAKSYFHLSDLLEGGGSVDQLDAAGNRIFAGGFSMYFSSYYSDNHAYHLSFNVGTCGSFTKEDKVQYNRYRILSEALDHAAEWEDYLISAIEKMRPLKTAFWNAENVRDKLEREKRTIIEDQKRAASDASIVIGKCYVNKCYNAWNHAENKIFKGCKAAKLMEIQNKRVLLEVGHISEWNPTTKQYDSNYKEFVSQDTYLMNKEDFYRGVYQGSIVETACIGDCQY